MKQQSSLELQKVSIRIQGRVLVNNLSLRVSGGDILTVMGASGTGKSTLLGFICGTLGREFDVQGKVLLNGREITGLPPQQRRIGILFQDALLFPHLSVAENLAFGIPAQTTNRQQRVTQALKDVGMVGFGQRDPATLSGGQRARITMMRTLLAEPQAVLLDEPFNKLDASLRHKIRQFVFSHMRRAYLPCLLVTHDQADADATKGRIIVLPSKRGKTRL